MNQTVNNKQNQEKGFLANNQKDIKDLIAPSGIDATSTNHLEIVGNTSRYARTMVVSALPRMCTFPLFLRGMYTFGNVNVSVFITPINPPAAVLPQTLYPPSLIISKLSPVIASSLT